MSYLKKIEHSEYQISIEKSAITALCFIIIILLLFPTYEYKSDERKIVQLNIIVEDIPNTKQAVFRPPPLKPAVPIPTENELIPEDETIESTNLNFERLLPASSGSQQGFDASSYIPPRPIAEVIPEYPNEDYKKGITGIIKLHVKINSQGKVLEVLVLENTTHSERCAKAAIKAAYQCRYFPARQGNKPVSCWTTRFIKFSFPKN